MPSSTDESLKDIMYLLLLWDGLLWDGSPVTLHTFLFIHVTSAVKPVHVFMASCRVSKICLMVELCFLTSMKFHIFSAFTISSVLVIRSTSLVWSLPLRYSVELMSVKGRNGLLTVFSPLGGLYPYKKKKVLKDQMYLPLFKDSWIVKLHTFVFINRRSVVKASAHLYDKEQSF